MKKISLYKVFTALLDAAIKDDSFCYTAELEMDTKCCKSEYVELTYGDLGMNIHVSYIGHIEHEVGGSDEHGNPELYDVWECDEVVVEGEYYVDGDKYSLPKVDEWLQTELEKR